MMKNKTMYSAVSRRVRSRRCGTSLVETMIAVFIFSLLLTAMILGLRAMAVGASQQVTDSGMSLNARRGVDEMLMQMRYSSGVVSSYTAGGQTYTTGDSTIVMQAFGYDPATVGIVLPDVTDHMIFKYDATKKEIRETLIPGAGSKRTARTNYLLARNVESIALTYRVREQFAQPVADSVHELYLNAASAPSVVVNGGAFTGLWETDSPDRITVNTSPGNDVQVLYPVSMSGNDIVKLEKYIRQVDVTVNFSDTDSRGTTRKLTMSGSACMRNRRPEDLPIEEP